ncbi:MAG: 6-phosphofructokinase [Betaproteobacteria bacterium]|nr:6-phosphofructokinase [Betaproteobacteria bacterium]
MALAQAHKFGILVGVGPAPGINSVIGAATIRARLQGAEVLGIRDGFAGIMRGSIEGAAALDIDAVSRIHFLGGSVIGTSRANPTQSAASLDLAVNTLLNAGITRLITIGGDDTAYSAMKIAQRAGDALHVAHVPKTIDNDLALPPHIDTFGFQTARHVGFELVKNLMVDARSAGRWYLVVAMGRKAGHLALGIAKAAGATLSVIPEEFPDGKTTLAIIADILSGAIIKRAAEGQRDGVAVLAEGLAECVPQAELEQLGAMERDPHGHIRIAEVELGRGIKKQVEARLAALGVQTTLVSKDIGYELRCADPIPFDMEYTRDLGYCAAKFLLEGGSNAMITLQGGQFVALPFASLLDPATGRTRVRTVDIRSTRYAIARRYMVRLRRDDFDNSVKLAALARAANMSASQFAARFGYVVEYEPPPLTLFGTP